MSGSDGTRLAGHLAARLGAWLSCNWRGNPASPAAGCSPDAHWCALSVRKGDATAPTTRSLLVAPSADCWPCFTSAPAAGPWTCSAHTAAAHGTVVAARAAEPRLLPAPFSAGASWHNRSAADLRSLKRGDSPRARVSDAPFVIRPHVATGNVKALTDGCPPKRARRKRRCARRSPRLRGASARPQAGGPGALIGHSICNTAWRRASNAQRPVLRRPPLRAGRNCPPRFPAPTRAGRLIAAPSLRLPWRGVPQPATRPRPCAQTARCPPVSLSAPPGGGTWS